MVLAAVLEQPIYLWLGWLVVVVAALLLRGRMFATFAAVILGLNVAIWTALASSLSTPSAMAISALGWITLLHFALLTRPRLRPLWYRLLVTFPASWFSAGTVLALPWALLAAFDVPLHGWWVPWAVAVVGLWTSLSNRRETVELVMDRSDQGKLGRVRSIGAADDAITLAQITDPHLGPFMSVARMRGICERIVQADPDLVAITGDLMTMESHGAPDALAAALEPLASLRGRVFASLGNHDHEDLATVRRALDAIGARLLVDEHDVVHTRRGPVHIIGADYHFRSRREKLAALFESVGPRNGTPRILLLHSPYAFRYLPDDACDLALSGHTHGGQLGLVSLGGTWTILKAFSALPDHGLWAQGRNRLYVHRGTGHYGFPLRLGVPGEESLLRLQFAAY